MQMAVVPAQNEEQRIQIVLKNLLDLKLDKVIVVINGSEDGTLSEALALKDHRIEVLYFKTKLGLDVPRAVGAKRALELGADVILFQDGDMVGHFHENQIELLNAVEAGVDVALTDCYPNITAPNKLAEKLLTCRTLLNKKLGWLELGSATPSHGPHALSQRALKLIPLRELAIPPMILSYAKKFNLRVAVATKLPHQELGSSIRGIVHSEKIMQTICGDCLEALSHYEGKAKSRQYGNMSFIGYHQDRNFSVLEQFLALETLEDFVACSRPPFTV